MTIRASLIVLALSLAALNANATDAPPAPSIPFTKYKLDNGLEVILAPDKRLPIVAVNLWYHVGAANEDPTRTGFAHLFEHMMFTGTKHVPRGMDDRLLEGAGVADSNASTSFDRTNYFDTLPSNQLELGLWIHADRMGYLLDALDQKALANQQDVVRNERRQTTENRPYGVVDEALFASLFPAGHPFRPAIIGSHADIQAARLADVRDFFKHYYRPNNATLVIAGDFDPADAKRLVQKYFGSFERGPDVPKPAFVTPPITSERRLTVTDRIELPRVDLAWHSPPAFAPGDIELKVAADILAGGKSSRLYKKLVYDQQIAQSVGADQDSYAQTAIFDIQALARPGHTPAELETAIDAELAQLARDGPTQDEVDRVRNVMERQLFEGLEKVGGNGGRANRLNYYNHYTGDPGYVTQDVERLRRVTPEGVRRAINTWLIKDARVVLFAERGEKKLAPDLPATPAKVSGAQTESINVDEKWRAHPPAPGREIVPRLPVPASFKLDNGLTVLHLERAEPPVVTARLIVPAGLGANPPATPGVADFSLSLLDEGTQTRNAPEIADAIAQLGAEIGMQTQRDASVVQIDALTAQFPAALAILADITLRPTFPAAEIERGRQSRLAAVVAARDDPGSVSDAAFRRALYGPLHPYGQTTLGTEASIKSIDRAALQDFWQRWFHPNNAALIVVGAIGRTELEALVKREFGAWGSASTPARPPVVALPPKATPARLVLVEKAGLNQTELRVGRVAATRATPDYYALQMLNEILGGGFTSRLNANLREAKGFAYSIFSRFDLGRAPGPFAVVTSVRTDATAAAVAEIDRELNRLRTTSPAAAEFAKARESLVRSLPSAFETNTGTSGAFGTIFTYGLPLDYYARLPANLRGVGVHAVDAAARRYLNPSQMVVVGVGEKGAIAPGLEKLGLLPVEAFAPTDLF
jgi:zinc protease